MIVIGDFGKSVKITGHPEQVALELEIAARTIRETYCRALGEEIGNDFFEEIIAAAKLTDKERDAEAREIWRRTEMESPELIHVLDASPLMKDLRASFKGQES